MAKKLEEWLKTDVKKANKMGVGKLSSEYFFRDPIRPSIINNELFYTPADGVILYQKIVNSGTDPILEIKGMNYSLQDLLVDSTYNEPSLVIGVFMSFYDVHINRIPYSGLLKYEQADAIQSYNMPMLALEKDILKKAINPDNMEYVKNNERMINTIYSPMLDYTYYVVQIADEDVDVIMPFCLDQNEPYNQNERFSQIRWGSQCDLILPLDDRFDFEIIQNTTDHVECSVDPLVKLIRKNHTKH